MPYAGNAIPLVSGTPAQVPATPQGGGGGSAAIAGVLLQNLSAFTLITGYGAERTVVPPFTAWPIPQTSGVVTVTPETLGATIPTGASSSLIPVYYRQGEELPPPTTLVAAAIASAIAGAVSITGGSVGISGGNVGVSGGQSGTPVTVDQQGTDLVIGASPATVAIPAGTAAIALWPTSLLGSGSLSVTGFNSPHITYYSAFGSGSGDSDGLPNPIVLYLDPAETSVQIQYSGSAPRGAAYTIAPSAVPLAPQRILTYADTRSGHSGTPVSGSASTSGATVITVPAGYTWKGSLWISAATASTSTQLQTAGSGANPAAGTALAVVNTGTRAGAEISVSDVIVQAPAANAVTIVTAVAGSPTFNAGASGQLL